MNSMKRLLLILSLALFITSCEDDNDIIRAVEGPALTVAVGSAAYTDAAGAGDDIELSMTGDFGVYEFDKVVSIFTNSNRKFSLEGSNNFSGTSQSDEGWSNNEKTLYAYAPYDLAATSVTSFAFELPSAYVQDVADPQAHLVANNFMASTTEVGAGGKFDGIKFVPQTCLLHYVFTNKTNGALTIDKLKYSNSSAGIPTKGVYNFREGSLSVSGGSSNLHLSLSEPVTLEVGETLTASIPMCVMTATRGSLISVEVNTDRGPVSFDETLREEKAYEVGKYYAQNIEINERSYLKPVTVNLPEKQNSFIVTPQESGVETFLMIPVSRVNEFWSTIDASKTIGDDTPWVAEIIWKDFDFNNKVLYMTEGGNKGVGTIDKINVTLNKADSDQWGNAVVGVKKADAQGNPVGDYLWSWHIWVSDVTTTAVQLNSQREAYFMDRHLGAKSADKEDGVLAQGLLYQWGRKDPFVGTAKNWYAADEKPTAAQTNYTWPAPVEFLEAFTTSTNSNTDGIEYAVGHPTTFIKRSHSSWAWAHYDQISTSDFLYKLWLGSEKTIYDPCPKGWRMPLQQSFGEGTANVSTNIATNANMSSWVWNDTYKGYEVSDVWFPAQMGLNGRTGGYGPDAATAGEAEDNIEDVTVKGFVVWTGQGSANSGYWGTVKKALCRHLYFTNEVIQPQLRGSGRANANPIRCIRYDAEDE